MWVGARRAGWGWGWGCVGVGCCRSQSVCRPGSCSHVQHTAVKCACATAMPCTLTRPRHAHTHTHTPAPIALQPASQPASTPARHRASQPSQRTCSWCRRIACARFGRVRRRGVVRGGGGGGVHHSCCNLLAWNSGMSAPTILTDFCLFVSEGDGLAGCGDVCSSFADQLCELVRLAKAKLARPYQPQQPCPALPCPALRTIKDNEYTCTYNNAANHHHAHHSSSHQHPSPQARWGDEEMNRRGGIDEYLDSHCDMVSCNPP